jgi:thiol peroxidase
MRDETRKDAITLRGKPMDVRGRMLTVGDVAPDFLLVANNLTKKTPSDYEGKVKLISVVPSLDTGVCDAQTRRFNQEAAALSDDIVVLTVSSDLPFAQRRWCGAAGVDRVETLSTHKDMQFSDDYGVHMLEWRANQRSIFVVDADNTIIYCEYVPEVSSEVDFAKALAATKQALKTES